MSEPHSAALEESGLEVFQEVKDLLRREVQGSGNAIGYEFTSVTKDRLQVGKASTRPGHTAAMREVIFLEYRSHTRRIEGEVGERRVSIKLEERNGKLILPESDMRAFVSKIILQLPQL